MKKRKIHTLLLVFIIILLLTVIGVLGLAAHRAFRQKETSEAMSEEIENENASEQLDMEDEKTEEDDSGFEEQESIDAGEREESSTDTKDLEEEATDTVEQEEPSVDTIEQEEPSVDTVEQKEESADKGKLVAIDAGHQLHGDSTTEPVGPGSSEMKAKVSSGTTGVSTGVPEYELNLCIAQKLKAKLLQRGYQVYMVRETNDVHISNMERALNANQSGADIYIRIHADGAESPSVRGASALYPTPNNPYVGYLSRDSERLSRLILDSYCNKTGFSNRGLSSRDDLTGTNWSQIPVTLIELGFMSNPQEDEKMQEEEFQNIMVEGLADGIEAYFE